MAAGSYGCDYREVSSLPTVYVNLLANLLGYVPTLSRKIRLESGYAQL